MYLLQRQGQKGVWRPHQSRVGKGLTLWTVRSLREEADERGKGRRPPSEDADGVDPYMRQEDKTGLLETSEPQRLLSPKSRDAHRGPPDLSENYSGLWGPETRTTRYDTTCRCVKAVLVTAAAGTGDRPNLQSQGTLPCSEVWPRPKHSAHVLTRREYGVKPQEKRP